MLKFRLRKYAIIITLFVISLLLCSCLSTSYISATWLNNITTYSMQANFAVYVMHENYDLFGRVVESQQGLGSGVLFKKVVSQRSDSEIKETEYYLLTNNHTVEASVDFDNSIFKVKDYKGNVFNAEVVCNTFDYDLSVVKFTVKDDEYCYNPLQLAKTNPEINTVVVAIGHPQGQANAVTVGVIRNYANVTSSQETQKISDVGFQVIYHDAPIDAGSSGGALLMETGEIVGINFAMTNSIDQEKFYGCAIPVEKIIEFLNSNEITY